MQVGLIRMLHRSYKLVLWQVLSEINCPRQEPAVTAGLSGILVSNNRKLLVVLCLNS